MDKELIERLAREAGASCIWGNLDKFAALVAEECSRIAHKRASQWGEGDHRFVAEDVAASIHEQFGRKQPFGLDALVADDGSLPAGFKGAGPNNFTFRSPPPKEYLTPWVVEAFVRLHSTPPDESGYVTAGHIVVSVKRLAGMSLNEFSTLMAESDARAMRLAQGLKG